MYSSIHNPALNKIIDPQFDSEQDYQSTIRLWIRLEPDWGQKKYLKVDQEHPKMDQEQPKIDPGGSMGSQIRHLDRAYIEFPDVK